jgi:hypothetical protein
VFPEPVQVIDENYLRVLISEYDYPHYLRVYETIKYSKGYIDVLVNTKPIKGNITKVTFTMSLPNGIMTVVFSEPLLASVGSLQFQVLLGEGDIPQSENELLVFEKKEWNITNEWVQIKNTPRVQDWLYKWVPTTVITLPLFIEQPSPSNIDVYGIPYEINETKLGTLETTVGFSIPKVLNVDRISYLILKGDRRDLIRSPKFTLSSGEKVIVEIPKTRPFPKKVFIVFLCFVICILTYLMWTRKHV